MICVIATIQVAEGRRDDFLEEFRKIVPLVREETGCIEYAPMVDISTETDAQSESTDPAESIVFVVEKWESVDALEAHLVASHMLDYRKRVKELVKASEIRILEPAE